MDTNDLVTVYTVSNPVEAEIIRNAIQAEGIRCFLDGAQQAADVGLLVFEIGVMVPAEDADRARKLIEQHEPHKKQ